MVRSCQGSSQSAAILPGHRQHQPKCGGPAGAAAWQVMILSGHVILVAILPGC